MTASSSFYALYLVAPQNEKLSASINVELTMSAIVAGQTTSPAQSLRPPGSNILPSIDVTPQH